MGYPDNPFKYGTQNWKLYERLKQGPIYNVEIVKQLHILKYTSRLSDVREAVMPMGMAVKKTLVGNGIYSYHLA